MAITSVGSLQAATAVAGTTVAVSPSTVGNCLVFASKVASPIPVTSLSGGGVTTWTNLISQVDSSGDNHTQEIWIGRVTTAGSSTVTVTFSSSVSGISTDLEVQEFTNGNTSTTWSGDATGFLNDPASGTVTFPTLTAAHGSELYVGKSRCPNSSAYVAISPWITVQSDANGNPYVYGVMPTQTTAGPTVNASPTASYTVGALLYASAPAFGAGSFADTATLTVNGIAAAKGSATLGSVSSLTVAKNPILSARSALTAGAVTTAYGAASLGGVSRLTATTTQAGKAQLSAVSNLTVSGLNSVPPINLVLPALPVPAVVNNPPKYRMIIAHTMTGRVVAGLPLSQIPSWNRIINASGSLSITLPLYPKLDADTLQMLAEPWRWTILWCYGSKILQGGMLLNATCTSGTPTLQVQTITFWDFLSSRRLTEYPGAQIDTTASDIVFSPTSGDVANQNLSWHSVARRLVEISVSGYPLQMPIILPDPIPGTSVITYAAKDVSYIGQQVTALCPLGPEIEFVAEFTDDSQSYFRWRMVIGNNNIGQTGYPHVWDYGKACIGYYPEIDGTNMTFYSFVKGQDNTSSAGGELLWAFTSFQTPFEGDWPFLWTADTQYSSETLQANLQAYADNDVISNENPIEVATMYVRMDGRSKGGEQTGSPSMDQVNIGDTAIVNLVNHPMRPDGMYAVRITQMGSGMDIFTAALSVQVLGVVQ